jgi:hypothetical protein
MSNRLGRRPGLLESLPPVVIDPPERTGSGLHRRRVDISIELRQTVVPARPSLGLIHGVLWIVLALILLVLLSGSPARAQWTIRQYERGGVTYSEGYNYSTGEQWSGTSRTRRGVTYTDIVPMFGKTMHCRSRGQRELRVVIHECAIGVLQAQACAACTTD